jgi:DNA-binding NtrC family response regulator
MSAYSELDYYRKAIKLHAVSFIEKPIVLEELEQEIRRAAALIGAEKGAARISEAEATQYALLGLLHQAARRRRNGLRRSWPPTKPSGYSCWDGRMR